MSSFGGHDIGDCNCCCCCCCCYGRYVSLNHTWSKAVFLHISSELSLSEKDIPSKDQSSVPRPDVSGLSPPLSPPWPSCCGPQRARKCRVENKTQSQVSSLLRASSVLPLSGSTGWERHCCHQRASLVWPRSVASV